VEGLREAFREGAAVPLRTMLSIERAPRPNATFALMPAWQANRAISVKLATVFPDNASCGLPTIHAQIVVFDGANGVPVAVLDGTEITRRRTAAASALAATYLARDNATRLLIVGTGAQAPHNALAHAAVRPIQRIEIWGRDQSRAHAVARAVAAERPDLTVQVVGDLASAVSQADIISSATSAKEPLIFGQDLRCGAMLDLVGAHTPGSRECDTEAVRRARVYVDALSSAMAEAGDVLIPISEGAINEQHVVGDLHGLCRGLIAGRSSDEEITLFKSVGTGLEDLAAARLVLTHSTAA
jgi:ornithine cyclodeaminase